MKNKDKYFDFLEKVCFDDYSYIIVNEHPQIIALVVACVPVKQAAEIIENLPPERQLSVIRRVAMLRPVEPEVIETIEKELESQMASGSNLVNVGGLWNTAEILNAIDFDCAQYILKNLSIDEPDLAKDIEHVFITEKYRKKNYVNLN